MAGPVSAGPIAADAEASAAYRVGKIGQDQRVVVKIHSDARAWNILQAEELRTGIVGCTKDIEAVAAAAKAGRISHVGEVGDGGEIGCEPSPGNRAEKAVRAGVNGERLRLRRWCLEQSDEAEDECSGFFHGVFDEYVNRGFAHGK